jgi:hypothetical protein
MFQNLTDIGYFNLIPMNQLQFKIVIFQRYARFTRGTLRTMRNIVVKSKVYAFKVVEGVLQQSFKNAGEFIGDKGMSFSGKT